MYHAFRMDIGVGRAVVNLRDAGGFGTGAPGGDGDGSIHAADGFMDGFKIAAVFRQAAFQHLKVNQVPHQDRHEGVQDIAGVSLHGDASEPQDEAERVHGGIGFFQITVQLLIFQPAHPLQGIDQENAVIDGADIILTTVLAEVVDRMVQQQG